jgi:Arc/MetJ-type ribon-helix-helix transcriptional regulator
MNRLTLRLDHPLYRALRARVKRDRITASEVVRAALHAHLIERDKQDAKADGMAAVAAQHADQGAAALDAMRAENSQLAHLVRDLLNRIEGSAEVVPERAPDPAADRLIENLISRKPAKE